MNNIFIELFAKYHRHVFKIPHNHDNVSSLKLPLQEEQRDTTCLFTLKLLIYSGDLYVFLPAQ